MKPHPGDQLWTLRFPSCNVSCHDLHNLLPGAPQHPCSRRRYSFLCRRFSGVSCFGRPFICGSPTSSELRGDVFPRVPGSLLRTAPFTRRWRVWLVIRSGCVSRAKIFSSRLPFWLRRSRQRLVAAGRLVGCAEAAAHDFLMSFERVHPSAAATNVIDGVEPSRRPDSLQLEVRLAALFRVAPLAACPWALPVARVIPRRLCISCTYERTPVAHG